jgi:hypothetical protein
MKYDSTLKSNCNEKVAYSYTWTLYSPSFWNLKIESWSYYCPLSWSSSLILWSELLWKIVISWNNEIKKVTVKNGKWKEKDVSGSIVFDDKKISIGWLQNFKNLSWLNSEYSEDSSKNINYSVNWKMADFNKNINKNLFKYTKWQTATNKWQTATNNNLLTWFSKKIHYYDFEWEEWTEINNNKWEILRIWIGWGWINYDIMLVTWQKVLYVKGWNLYINADISNNDIMSQLVIVVKRDSTNRKNGWNVYINPNVTNIDATIIADWSIISFDWDNILNAKDDTNWLRKQLLIYGSISTKNTFWEDKAIYWTDDYIKNWGKEWNTVWTYNLAKLRSFQVMSNNEVTEWKCKYDLSDVKVVARSNSWTWALEYAFAGKKECFLLDDTLNSLRWTEKLTPLVIEYNTIMQSNSHFILQK